MSVEMRTDAIAPMMPMPMIPSRVVETRTSASVSPRSPRRRIATLVAIPWRPPLPWPPAGGSIGPKSPDPAVASATRHATRPGRRGRYCAPVPSHGVDPFAENDDQQALRALARDVAARELAPRAREGDETEEFPQASWDAIRQADLFGITIDPAYGGMGMGDIEAAIVLEELARADVSSAILAQLIFNGPPRAIEHLGSDALKERWLPMAASGEALMCIGISETEAGSAVGHMRARLTPDGDGYRLNAYKNYVTGGHKSRACLVWCRFPGSEGTKGIGAVLVDLTADGVSVAGNHEQMGLRPTSDEAIQLLGGYGFSREYPVERVYRDIRVLCIGAGTVEVQRNFIGTNLLRGRTPSGHAWIPPVR